MHAYTAMADSRDSRGEHAAKRARVLPSAAEAADSTVRLCEELATSKWKGVLDQSATDPAGLYDALVSAVKAHPVDLSDEENDAEVMEGTVPAALCSELKEVWEQPDWDDSKVLRVRVDAATRVQGAGVVDLLIRDATHTLRAVCIPSRGKCSTVLAAMYGGAVADVRLRHTVLVTREFHPVKNRHVYVSRKRFLVLRYTDVTAATGDATGLDPAPVHLPTHPAVLRPQPAHVAPSSIRDSARAAQAQESDHAAEYAREFAAALAELEAEAGSESPRAAGVGVHVAVPPEAAAPVPSDGSRGGAGGLDHLACKGQHCGACAWTCVVCSCMHARACNCHLDTFDSVCGRACVCVCTCLRTQASSGPCTRTALCTRQDRWTYPPVCASPTTTHCRKCAAFWWTTPTRQMAPWQTGSPTTTRGPSCAGECLPPVVIGSHVRCARAHCARPRARLRVCIRLSMHACAAWWCGH